MHAPVMEYRTPRWQAVLGCCLLTASLALVAIFQHPIAEPGQRSFSMENDRFVKDGHPMQLISGRCTDLASPSQTPQLAILIIGLHVPRLCSSYRF